MMAKSIKNIIATLFVVILVCKTVLTLVGTFSPDKQLMITSQAGLVESENSDVEEQNKSVEKQLIYEDFAELILPIVILPHQLVNSEHLPQKCSPLTDLAVFSPPPEFT